MIIGSYKLLHCLYATEFGELHMYVVRWKWAGVESSVVAQADTYAYQVAEASFQHTFITANNMCDIWAKK